MLLVLLPESEIRLSGLREEAQWMFKDTIQGHNTYMR